MVPSTNQRDDVEVREDRREAFIGAFSRFTRVSWGALLAGFAVAIALQMLFSVLGLWLNAWTYDIGSDGIAGLSTTAAFWWLFTGTIAVFFGGWIAAYLSGTPSPTTGSAHGLVVWGLLTLTSFYFAGSVLGSVLSATAYTLNSSVAAVTGGSSTQEVVVRVEQPGQQGGDAEMEGDVTEPEKLMASVPLSTSIAALEEILRETDKEQLQPEQLKKEGKKLREKISSTLKSVAKNPQEAEQKLKSLLDTFYEETEDERQALDQAAFVSVLDANTTLNEDEAKQVVENWGAMYKEEIKPEAKELARTLQQRYEKASASADDLAAEAQREIVATAQAIRQDAKQVAQSALDTIAATAGWCVLTLVLGVAAGLVGGVVGTRPMVPETQHRENA